MLGEVDSVTSITVAKLTDILFNISWSPVFSYDGLTVFYNISLNEKFDIQSYTWKTFDVSEMDVSENIIFSVTLFINSTDQILVGNTSQWDNISK